MSILSPVAAAGKPPPVIRPPRPQRPRKPAALVPVHGVCRWMIPPIPVRDFLSGVLRIDATEYTVTLPADRSGARLTKEDGTRTQYHVDLSRGGCDCPDATYRPRPDGCKHLCAVRAAVARLPVRQKFAACPRCCERVEAPGLCPVCTADETEFAGYHQQCEMAAGPELPELEEVDYFDVADLS